MGGMIVKGIYLINENYMCNQEYLRSIGNVFWNVTTLYSYSVSIMRQKWKWKEKVVGGSAQ